MRLTHAALVCMHRRCTSEILNELELWSCLRTARESFALLNHLPLFGNQPQGIIPVGSQARLDEPATNDKARSSDPTSAMHCGYSASFLVVLEDVENLPHKVNATWEISIRYGEIMVFDLLHVYAK
ncbi:hypothetical protein NLI96_g11995 [Meripilus lineatus]|uniref:Uncharacterized protein n=1 Tax=Meripilus lineatus TaxID=2056292 RepID=A0AAD5UQP3_9APHY|nr:hypothetical protein NLI96_g11995 [Physisporinus lineatus]